MFLFRGPCIHHRIFSLFYKYAVLWDIYMYLMSFQIPLAKPCIQIVNYSSL